MIPLFIQAAVENRPASINGDGETSRDFTFVENVVQANIRAITAPLEKHEVINVACGGATSLNELWKMISENLGVDLDPVYAPPRKGDIKHSLASIEKATMLVGYKPLVEMKEGLKATIDWGIRNAAQTAAPAPGDRTAHP